MRGMLKQRYKGSWSLIIDDYQIDPASGARVRKRRWITFRGKRQQAETKLNELVRAADRGEFVEPSKMTVNEWLTDWVEKAIKPPRKAQSTYDGYCRIIEQRIAPVLGSLRLQSVKALDIEAYYSTQAKLAPATVQVHHAILHSALSAAVKAGLVFRNVAALVSNKPKKVSQEDVLDHVWSADEAACFLTAAKAAGTQPAAFYSLALDSGARRGELAALQWTDLDLQAGKLTIRRQLLTGGSKPTFGPTKTKLSRTIELSAETVALLKVHKSHQAEVKMANRTAYTDHGLMFAKEWLDVQKRGDSLGHPLQVNNIGQREYARIIKAAGVRSIKFHGMRHTVATLMLSAGVPAHVVQRRLGHAKIEMTLGIYAHALPAMQQDAAARLAAMLHGNGAATATK